MSPTYLPFLTSPFPDILQYGVERRGQCVNEHRTLARACEGNRLAIDSGPLSAQAHAHAHHRLETLSFASRYDRISYQCYGSNITPLTYTSTAIYTHLPTRNPLFSQTHTINPERHLARQTVPSPPQIEAKRWQRQHAQPAPPPSTAPSTPYPKSRSYPVGISPAAAAQSAPAV